VNKFLYIGLILLCTVSCVEPFQPEIKDRQDLLVVDGRITDKPGPHYVRISRASPYNDPGFIPVKGCVVRIEDQDGRGVTYAEYEPGNYRADLDESFLDVNNAYRLYVYTVDGEEYLSDYDSLLPCPPVDSLFYEIDFPVSDDPEITFLGGVQIYVDIRGEKDDSRNFLWELEETYKYLAHYFIQYLWENDSVYEFDPPSDSLTHCYKSGPISEIYTATTRRLVTNDLNKYPLNYVSAWGPRLRYEYGLLVTQYSLSDEAYLYWEKIRTLTDEEGSLYESQPANADGNIHNINDPEEQILCFFYASQVQEKWIQFERPITEMYNLDEPCWLQLADLDHLESGSFMVSVDEDGMGPPYGSGNNECFDCRMKGGSLEPPTHWQKDE
jgi:hypothetical protein